MKRSTKTLIGRTRWTAADAEAVLEALEASGQALAEFGRERGVLPDRLSRWRRRLGSRPSSAALVPVTVNGARAIRVGSAGLVVETASVRVEVHDYGLAAAAWVAELVRLTGAEA
jgi:hypothetical protein